MASQGEGEEVKVNKEFLSYTSPSTTSIYNYTFSHSTTFFVSGLIFSGAVGISCTLSQMAF